MRDTDHCENADNARAHTAHAYTQLYMQVKLDHFL